VADFQQKRVQLTADYKRATDTYTALKHQIELLESAAEDMSYGLYEPYFKFDTPEEYKQKIQENRERQKALIHANKAVNCPVSWTVGNSKREGERMVKQTSKLALLAFNGECDAAVADVTWSNIEKMEHRITQVRESIHKLTGVLQISITKEYLQLKLDELHLKNDYERKRYEDREEQRRIREQLRDEERAKAEIEQAKKAAELEEQQYQKVLEKAKAEAAQAVGDKLEKLTEQISTFEGKLDEARAKKEKAIARAQLTKSGFVYVISNIGSFGEGVFKIGMTRRLEPMDRINELGGASVPFPFDLHAMLWSDDAPALEYALHQEFANRRVNLVNNRREFYQQVQLSEIEQFVKQRGLSAQFIEVPEAREYHLSEARRKADAGKLTEIPDQAEPQFPDNLFDEEAA
jgi:hypothetical protein